MINYGPTPLIKLNPIAGFKCLYVKDESVHANGTFKDRLSQKALQRYPTDTTLAVISYGNTAISIARMLRESNLRGTSANTLVAFLPKDYDDWELGPSSLGTMLSGGEVLDELRQLANVIQVDLSSKLLSDEVLQQLTVEAGVLARSFVNITEGLDIPSYVDIIEEIVSQLGSPPDICVVPFGAGILCNEISDYIHRIGHGKVIALSVANCNSLAKMLYGPLWVNTKEMAEKGMAYSQHQSPDRTGSPRRPYSVFLVHEHEILEGLRIAQQLGISAEPSGAVGLGVLHRLHDFHPNIRPDQDIVIVINTGNGIDGFVQQRRP